MIRVLTLMLVLMVIGACAHDEEPETLYSHLQQTILEGYFVTDIAFNSNGTAWIATFKQGLIRYQAGQITVFDSHNSILNDSTVILCLRIDSHNNLWIGTDYGLIRFNGNEFSLFNSQNSPMPIDPVMSLVVDQQDNVWAAVCRFKEGGLVKFDGNEWTIYTPENSDLPDHLISDLEIDQDNNLWIALSSNLIRVSGQEWKIYSQNDFSFQPYSIGKIRSNQKNELIAQIDYSYSSSMCFDQPVIFKFDGQNCKILAVQDSALTVSWPLVLATDRQDHIWCTFRKDNLHQLGVYDGNRWNYIKDSVIAGDIYTIRQAQDRRMWIGTANGIYIYR